MHSQPDFFRNAQMSIQIVMELAHSQQKSQLFLSRKLHITQPYNYSLLMHLKQLGFTLDQCDKKIIQYQTKIKRKSMKLQTCVSYWIKTKQITKKVLSKLEKQKYEKITSDHEYVKLIKEGNCVGLTFLADQGSKVTVYEKN